LRNSQNVTETDYFEEYYNFVLDRAKRYDNAIAKFEPGQYDDIS